MSRNKRRTQGTFTGAGSPGVEEHDEHDGDDEGAEGGAEVIPEVVERARDTTEPVDEGGAAAEAPEGPAEGAHAPRDVDPAGPRLSEFVERAEPYIRDDTYNHDVTAGGFLKATGDASSGKVFTNEAPDFSGAFDETLCRSIINRVLAKRLCVIRRKASAVEMQTLARAFNIGALFWNVPTEKEFLDDYDTTLGPVIYVGGKFRYNLRGVRGIAHEVEHWEGMKAHGLVMAAEYLTNRDQRLVWELDAEVARWELEFYLTGELPPRAQLTRLIKHGYNFDDTMVPFSEKAAMQRLVALQDGEVVTESGRALIESFQAHGIGPRVFASYAALDAG